MSHINVGGFVGCYQIPVADRPKKIKVKKTKAIKQPKEPKVKIENPVTEKKTRAKKTKVVVEDVPELTQE